MEPVATTASTTPAASKTARNPRDDAARAVDDKKGLRTQSEWPNPQTTITKSPQPYPWHGWTVASRQDGREILKLF
jgi:hypothetical protein